MKSISPKTRKDRIGVMRRLKKWAAHKGMPQTELADKLGLSQGYVSHLLQGNFTPSRDIVVRAETLMASNVEKKSQVGRKKVKWTHVTVEDIERYRKDNRIPASQMAGLLGVVTTTYYNWRRGKCVPTLSNQRRIKKIISRGPRPAAIRTNGRNRPLSPVECSAIGSIVKAYIEHRKDLKPDDVVDLTRSLSAQFATI